MHMFSYEAEAHCLHEDRKDPGYRIGNKQETQRPVCREKSEDPHNPGSYGTDNRKNHRYSGISHSPEGSREQIHNTTTEIWYCSKGKDFHATADYICITGVDLQKFRSKEIRSTAKGQCHTDRKDHTVQKYSVHSFQFLYSIVLTGETHTGLGDCIDRHIEKAKNIIGSSISCHCHRTKRVYRRLQKGIGQVDHCTLDTCRYSYLEDLLQILCFDS